MNLLFEPQQVVTASRRPEPDIESPAIITVINRDRIRLLGARTLPELLATVPGFSPWRSVAGDWWPGIRGVFDSNRSFMVMIDGVSLNNQLLGSPYWTWDLIDPRRFSRIEILRGPASAVYGANAFLAVINCITDGQRCEGSEIRTTIGTDGTRGFEFSHAAKHRRGQVMLDLGAIGSDGQSKAVSSDLYNRSGTTRNRSTRRDAMLKVTGPNEFSLLAHHVEGRRSGYIGYYDALNDETFFTRSNDQISLKYCFDCASAGSLRLNLYWNRAIDEEAALAVPPGGTFMDGITYPFGAFEDNFTKDTVYGASLRWSQPEPRRSRLSIETSWNAIELNESTAFGSYGLPANPGARVFLNGRLPSPEKFRHSSLNIQEDLELSQRSRLVLGGRLDNHSLFGETISPRLGYIKRLGRIWTGKFLYGQAFRNPDFHEIASNRQIRREQIQTTEIQLIGEFPGHWVTKVNVFNSDIHDRIASGRLITQYQNIGETRYDGLELSMKKRFLGTQEAFLNFATFRKTYESQDPLLAPGLPHNRLNAGLIFPARPWSLSFWGTFTSDQERNYEDPRDPTTGLRLLHFTAQRDDLANGKGRLILRVHNLLNTSWGFVTPPIPGQDERFPQDGRQIELEYDHQF